MNPGKTIVRRVGGFPEPMQAIWEGPEALRQSHCVGARFGLVGGCFPRARL